MLISQCDCPAPEGLNLLDGAALLVSVVALAVAVVVAVWEWKARPRVVWSVAYRMYTGEDGQKLQEVHVRSGGTAVAYDVRIHSATCDLQPLPGEDRMPRPDMTLGSPAYVQRITRIDGQQPVIVIAWFEGWPVRERGLRVNLVTGLREDWRWHRWRWFRRSLQRVSWQWLPRRLRRRRLQRWWRLCRKPGRWKARPRRKDPLIVSFINDRTVIPHRRSARRRRVRRSTARRSRLPRCLPGRSARRECP